MRNAAGSLLIARQRSCSRLEPGRVDTDRVDEQPTNPISQPHLLPESRPRTGLDRFRSHGFAACAATKFETDLSLAPIVLVDDWGAVWRGPTVAPVRQRDKVGDEVATLLGLHVLVLPLVLRVWAYLHEVGGDVALQKSARMLGAILGGDPATAS